MEAGATYRATRRREGRRRREAAPAMLNLRQTWSGSLWIEGELDEESGATLADRDSAATDGDGATGRRGDAGAAARGGRAGGAGRRRGTRADLDERGGERPHLTCVASLSTLRLEPGRSWRDMDGRALYGREAAADRMLVVTDLDHARVVCETRDGRFLTWPAERGRCRPADAASDLNLAGPALPGPGLRGAAPGVHTNTSRTGRMGDRTDGNT